MNDASLGSHLGSQVLMARQPIFDRQQRVVAYEILYRTENETEGAVFYGGSQATSEVLLNEYTSICDAGEIKRVPAFLNLTYDIVVEGNIPDLPKKQIVLELLEDATVDEAFIIGVKNLVDQGYRIALDDFVYGPEYIPLLELAQIVKIDVLAHTHEELVELIKIIKPYKVSLLAEKIETHEMLEACIEMGFKLFQGYFLSRPKLIKGRKISTGQIALLQLMQALQNPNVKPEVLEKLIITDPVLTYKLLRIVNSSAYSLVRKVESISEAIVMLGIPQIKKWTTLIAMSTNADKPEELSRALLIRGRMSENVAEHQKKINASSYFMAGMMSGLHALLDIERDKMLEQVPLGDEIKAAICDGSGDIGIVLNNVINYEAGNWELLPEDFDGEIYEQSYREAMQWTKEAMQAMTEN
ncbi:EAL and HDOD domain-containing protein [Neptunomonas qingdaonensis]|uniref:EAL and modified HD-GYP domain-containing signal transduction protein n=1 Tax=Neptunomonas qingdaonensis TaxID=1045558 RepID=A0A1I2QYU6_9GAMM|nr:HDOD domain-containing protein [Neptunomonas qingdaonensis]SFG32903.1 EAL and modified HD-GYP domain-containing signal transduction protein [Neptunomonas qingdaonensis]